MAGYGLTSAHKEKSYIVYEQTAMHRQSLMINASQEL